MSWFSRVVGGTVELDGERPIGFLRGRDLGIGPGATFDGELAEYRGANATFKGAVSVVRWGDGICLTGRIDECPGGTEGVGRAVISIQVAGKMVEAEKSFANDRHDYWVESPVSEGWFLWHLPFPVLRYPDEGVRNAMLNIHLLSRTTPPKMLATRAFALDLPARTPWQPVGFFEPLVRLCMGVAYADGSLDSDEADRIKTYFLRTLKLSRSQEVELQVLMNDGPPADLDMALEDVVVRFPDTLPSQLMEFLSGVAFADGVIDAMEVRFIRDVGSRLDLDDKQLDSVCEQLGLAV